MHFSSQLESACMGTAKPRSLSLRQLQPLRCAETVHDIWSVVVREKDRERERYKLVGVALKSRNPVKAPPANVQGAHASATAGKMPLSYFHLSRQSLLAALNSPDHQLSSRVGKRLQPVKVRASSDGERVEQNLTPAQQAIQDRIRLAKEYK